MVIKPVLMTSAAWSVYVLVGGGALRWTDGCGVELCFCQDSSDTLSALGVTHGRRQTQVS